MRCLAGLVDAEGLEALFGGNTGTPSVEIIAAMIECGMEMLGSDEDDPQFDAEKFACLR